ncbi:MAG: radical SAM protein [Alphaproteobacteria bacterium]|nr:radical SAM protein [Alphaproteobacteria bacterium]
MPHLRVTPMADMLLVELDLALARCRMHCVFCPERYVTERAWDVPTRVVDEVLAEARALVAGDARRVYLESADILEFPGFDALVETFTADGRELLVATPGLRLADPDLVARHAGRRVRFDLTLHGTTDATWEAMTGRADARALVEQALDHLVGAGVPVHVSMVVTDRNVHELADTVRRAGARWKLHDLSVKLFFPDTSPDGAGRHPGYLDQFPDLEAVEAQLRALAEAPDGLPRVDLYNLPFCQADEALLERLGAYVLDCFNAYRGRALPQCASCPVVEACPGIHLRYLAKHRVRRPSHAKAVAVREGRAPEPVPQD